MVKESLAKYIEDPGSDFVERKVKFKPDQTEKIHRFVNIGVNSTQSYHYYYIINFY